MTQKNSKDSVQSEFLQIDLNYRFPLLVSLDPQMAGTKRQDSCNRIYPAIRGEFFIHTEIYENYEHFTYPFCPKSGTK